MSAELPARISVVGTTGAGKTTLARRLAQATGAPHVELDACYWDRDWKPAPREVFLERLRAGLSGPRWVVDGHCGSERYEVWSRADAVVWLDLSLGVILAQLLRRTVSRAWHSTELWHGNRESWRHSFLSRESVLLWALQTHARRCASIPALLARPEYAHLRVVRLRTPAAVERFTSRIAGRLP